MSAAAFLAETARTCRAANAASLDWLLARPEIGGGFLNTRQNSLTLADYTDSDGWRSPRYLSGWIQGRGLEALLGHAAALAAREPALSAALTARAWRLAPVLAELAADCQGHVYFAYDLAAPGGPLPVRPGPDGAPEPQARPVWLYTYSDAFAAKGLVAAAAALAPEAVASRLAYLADVIAAIESGRFQMDEKAVLGAATLAAQPDDFGPRMILLGAAGLLHRIGQQQVTAYADRFIAHILDRHYDLPTGLLRNVPGEDACNVGHGIEFVGFALQHLPADADPTLIATLERILVASFAAGFVGPGITLSVSVETGKALSPYCPWWSLPETMRAAALVYARTRNDDILSVWQAANRAFFTRYWRAEFGVAYQTLDRDGPADYVPATPDLDPGYHTGLSLAAAAAVAEALTA